MIIWLYHYLVGYLTVEIDGISQERFINMCIHHNIKVWKLDTIDNKYRFQLLRRDFKKLKPIMRKTEVKIRILERFGIPFFLFRHRKRQAFLAGFMVFCISMVLFTRVMWNIEISGNQLYTDEMILKFLNQNDVQITMPIKNIDCDNIVSILRAEFENITWVSAHIDGCILVISIKENDQLDASDLVDESVGASELEEASNAIEAGEEITSLLTEMPSDDGTALNSTEQGLDIIAQESGTISSIITLSGTPLVHIGDEVSEGDILVSGCLEVYNDSQEVIAYHYVEADADISIATEYTYSETMELIYEDKVYSENVRRKYYLRIGGFYIETKMLRPLDSLCDITRTEMSLLSEQQSLWSLSIGKATYQEYEWVESVYTDKEVQNIMTEAFGVYCDELIQKKVEILENDVNIYIDEKYAIAEGKLQVVVENEETAVTEILKSPDEVAQEGITE